MQELDLVVLADALPEHRLCPGGMGTIVLVHGGGKAYEVEFTTLTGRTVIVTTLNADQLRPAHPTEIPHARPLEA
jgi:hypothetical protein